MDSRTGLIFVKIDRFPNFTIIENANALGQMNEIFVKIKYSICKYIDNFKLLVYSKKTYSYRVFSFLLIKYPEFFQLS